MPNNLKKLREDKGLTQTDLGEIFGLTKTAISLYENDKRGIDSKLAVSLADYFGVTTDYLLGRTITMQVQVHDNPEGYGGGDLSNPTDIDRAFKEFKDFLEMAGFCFSSVLSKFIIIFKFRATFICFFALNLHRPILCKSSYTASII